MEERVHLAPVVAYSSELEADLVVARLAESGIRAFVKSDGLGGAFPGMPMATGGFQVMVTEEDVDRARATVLEMGGQAADRSTGALNETGWRLARWLIPAAAALLILSAAIRGLF
ncbi:MAG: DUF2007 domain-containing protein [bacterium]|nr:DUF2007 domain-containing protein [bacterium]